MSDLLATAERLRVVKQAYEHFLALWALDHLLEHPAATKRFRSDIVQADDDELMNPHNHNWSLLYRGSVLDD